MFIAQNWLSKLARFAVEHAFSVRTWARFLHFNDYKSALTVRINVLITV